MTVVTGDKLGAGTDADVYLQMFGELGESPTMAQTILYCSPLLFYFALYYFASVLAFLCVNTVTVCARNTVPLIKHYFYNL